MYRSRRVKEKDSEDDDFDVILIFLLIYIRIFVLDFKVVIFRIFLFHSSGSVHFGKLCKANIFQAIGSPEVLTVEVLLFIPVALMIFKLNYRKATFHLLLCCFLPP